MRSKRYIGRWFTLVRTNKFARQDFFRNTFGAIIVLTWGGWFGYGVFIRGGVYMWELVCQILLTLVAFAFWWKGTEM